MGCEEYGIDILRVPEIPSHEHPTRMANATAFVKGVINQPHPVPEFSLTIGGNHVLAISSIQERMRILLDIENS